MNFQTNREKLSVNSWIFSVNGFILSLNKISIPKIFAYAR